VIRDGLEQSMDYSTWEKSVPEAITTDPLWRVEAYRLALFLADLGWNDVTKLMSDRRTLSLADQLYRAVGGIGSQMQKAIPVVRAGIAPDSMNTRWDPRGKPETGTIKDDTFLESLLSLIVLTC
jgi:hypothetical protein